MSDFSSIPFPESETGRRAYNNGRALVLEHGLHPRHIMWDCDEVLWDWAMSARRVMRKGPFRLVKRDLGHREWFQLKPGIFELLWGLHHGALEAGDDSPWIRLWTNGYHWRIWRIAREVPGFAQLLGPPADVDDQLTFWQHPRIFGRANFAAATRILLDPSKRDDWLARFQPAAVEVLEDQLERTPFDSHLKIPELATVLGREDYSDVWVLVDDRGTNIKRFVLTGRSGVRIRSTPSRIVRGRVPNMTWGDPVQAVEVASSCLIGPLADALAVVARSPRRTSPTVERGTPVPVEYPRQRFTIDVVDRYVREQWLGPVRDLKRDFE